MMVRPVELVLPGIRLRPWCTADAPAVLAARGDAAIALWSPEGGGSDLDSVRSSLAEFADWSSGERACFALEDDTGALAGSVRLYRIDPARGHAEVGYWTAATARGRGLTYRAVDAVAVWAFEHLGLRHLELSHAVANPASCRVAERAGFRLDGTFRLSYRYGDGRLYDEHRHVRLAPTH
jgi:RimJ/RimL family protein N-acetyltransferase